MSTTLVAITGHTYYVRKDLKALGARWDPERKAWMIPSSLADKARRIVQGRDVCAGCGVSLEGGLCGPFEGLYFCHEWCWRNHR